MSGIYVTDTGFQKKTLSEIKSELELEFQNIFGNDIDLDESGPFGQIIGIFSKYLAENWDSLEEIYTCRNPEQASGICLDNIVAENAITRLPSTETIAQDVLLYGNEGTVVLAGKKAKQSIDSIDYILQEDVTIGKASARIGVIEVTTVSAGTYRVTINSINYDYVASGGESKTDILDAIEALITAGTWEGIATVATEQLTLTDLDLDFSFDITGNLNIVDRASGGKFRAEVVGSNPLPANSLDEIVTPVVGWNSVINPFAGITGREIETDDELRLRREQSIISGNATDDAIKSNVINNVSGVVTCRVYSNRTDNTDSEGRPPHSFETVVEGGTDEDIAQEIWKRMPSGIETYGNVNGGSGITIQDSQGFDQVIKFSRPENVYIFIKVKRDFNTEETYPANGDDLIKQAIVNWSLLSENVSVGKDIIIQKLAEPIYTVPGIADIEITADSSTTLPHTPTYSDSNITITGRQIAVFSTDRIVVESF